MEDSLEQFIKLTRNTKNGQVKEEQIVKISKQEVITAQRKRECDSRAVKIVEFLIEGKLRPEVFLRCLKHLNQSFYQDVVEERAISMLCGYTLCDKEIPNMPNKHFFIDSKCNKVYDLTERKNFCSNFCYRASLHIKSQIDDSPLWLRRIDEAPKFEILPNTVRGSPGEEVNQGIAKPAPEPSFTSISSFAEISLEDLSNDEIKKKNSNKKNHKLETLQEIDESAQLSNISESVNFSVPKDAEEELHSKVKITTTRHKKKTYKPAKIKKDVKNIFDNIKKYVNEWMTLDTYIFMYGEEHMKLHVDEKHLRRYFENSKHTASTTVQKQKYLEICKKLQLNELVDDSFDKSVLGFKIEPVPDYKQLKDNTHDLELKVRSFYTGQAYELEGNQPKDASTNEISNQCEEIDNPAILPLVDVNSQNALRRKIYLNSISKAMVALTKGLQIPSQHILEQLKLLVKTFQLQAHNVIFEPFLWSFIAFILIKMLSIRDDNLRAQLDRKQSKIFINAMLGQLPDADVFFKDLFSSIENIDLFLQCSREEH